jgi:hypothetical protein
MSKIRVTPWSNNDEPSGNTEFVCAYENYVGIDHVTEELRLKRTQRRDELWAVGLAGGPVATKPRGKDTANTAAIALAGALIRGRVRFSWPMPERFFRRD